VLRRIIQPHRHRSLHTASVSEHYAASDAVVQFMLAHSMEIGGTLT
jgi:hypothetical protein